MSMRLEVIGRPAQDGRYGVGFIVGEAEGAEQRPVVDGGGRGDHGRSLRGRPERSGHSK